jgi:hypothetical protein
MSSQTDEANTQMQPDIELQAYLNDWYRRLPTASGRSSSDLKISPALDPQEAQDFLAGLRENLFRIDELGFAQSRLLPLPPARNDRQKLFQMFWHGKDGTRFLFREGVSQLAAASALVLNYGWPEEQVRLEPNKKDLGGLAYGVDLIVLDQPGGRGLIFGEAKAESRALNDLIREITACGRAGLHDRSACKRSQHPKFAACWDRKPSYFWAVCPGERKAFELTFTETSLEFHQIDDIPGANGAASRAA